MVERARCTRVEIPRQMIRRLERRAGCRRAEHLVEHLVARVGVDTGGAGQRERTGVGQNELPMQRELLVLQLAGVVAEAGQHDVEPVPCGTRARASEVHREPDGLTHADVAETDRREADDARLGIVLRYVDLRDLDGEVTDRSLRKRHRLTIACARRGIEGDVERVASVEVQPNGIDRTGETGELREGDMVGADRPIRMDGETGADRVGADAPRGPVVTVERVRGPVGGHDVVGRAHLRAALLDHRARRIGRSGERLQPKVVVVAGRALSRALGVPALVADPREVVLAPAAVRIGQHQVGIRAQRLRERAVVECRRLEDELVPVEQTRGRGIDDAVAVARHEHRLLARSGVDDRHRALHVEQCDRGRI